jgi:heat shock protein HslJ
MNRPAAASFGFAIGTVLLILTPMQQASAVPFSSPTPQVKLTPEVFPAFDIFRRPDGQEAPMATTPGLTLEGEPWTIDSASGIASIAAPRPRLTFSDGRLRFDAPCNFYLTGFTLSGNDLAFEPFEDMPKVCDPDVMALETALLSHLARVTGFVIDAEGTLILYSLGNEVLRAGR